MPTRPIAITPACIRPRRAECITSELPADRVGEPAAEHRTAEHAGEGHRGDHRERAGAHAGVLLQRRADVGEGVQVGQLEEEHDGQGEQHLLVEPADR
jgi:hypothetical protein